MAKVKTFLVYMNDEALVKRIENAAQDEGRSESGQIKFMIKKFYETQDKKKK